MWNYATTMSSNPHFTIFYTLCQYNNRLPVAAIKSVIVTSSPISSEPFTFTLDFIYPVTPNTRQPITSITIPKNR